MQIKPIVEVSEEVKIYSGQELIKALQKAAQEGTLYAPMASSEIDEASDRILSDNALSKEEKVLQLTEQFADNANDKISLIKKMSKILHP